MVEIVERDRRRQKPVAAEFPSNCEQNMIYSSVIGTPSKYVQSSSEKNVDEILVHDNHGQTVNNIVVTRPHRHYFVNSAVFPIFVVKITVPIYILFPFTKLTLVIALPMFTVLCCTFILPHRLLVYTM